MSDRRTTIGGLHNYTYRAEWCIDEYQYVARCLEFPGLFARALTAPEAIRGIEAIVAENVSLNQWAVQKLAGRRPPAPDGFF